MVGGERTHTYAAAMQTGSVYRTIPIGGVGLKRVVSARVTILHVLSAQARRLWRLAALLVEPTISIFLVWLLFHMFETSRPAVKYYNIDVQLNPDFVKLRADGAGNLQGGEDLLFLRSDTEVKGTAGLNAAAGMKGEGSLGKPPPAAAPVKRYPLEIPDYARHRYCNGRRWELTRKTAEQYHLVGYSELMESTRCNSQVCDVNRDRAPLVMNFSRPVCDVNECVTVTIKTRFRYVNVMTFIISIHRTHPRMRVIVMDEEQRERYVNRTEIDDWELFLKQKQTTVSYIQARPGVAYGRKLGAMLAKTKYILVVDDDYQFTVFTNITKLLSVIELSDAAIVAGDTSDAFPFAGVFRATRNTTDSPKVDLALYPNVFYELVQCFRACYVADIVKTFFIADRKAILAAGAWDSERLFYEHEDFFITIRKARLKVVNCKDVVIRHEPADQRLAAYRRESFYVWQRHLFNKWKINDLYICEPDTYMDRDAACVKKRHFA